jgi:hypothetical protein
MNKESLGERILIWILLKVFPWLIIVMFLVLLFFSSYLLYDKFLPSTKYIQLDESKWKCVSGFEYHSDGYLTRIGRRGDGMQFVCTEYKMEK